MSRYAILSHHRLVHLRDLLSALVVRDLKVRYQRSLLGIAWSWLKPLSQLFVFLFVFGAVMPLSIPHYASYLFVGVLAWSWFGNSVVAAATAITGNPELVRRPGFPVTLLPVLVVMNEAIHFVLALPILIAVVWLDAGPAGATALALPLVMIVQFLFTLSLCYAVAASHVQFRDTQDAVSILIMVAFYLTPVFYQAKAFHSGYEVIQQLNPMSQIIAAYRTILIDHQAPAPMALLSVAAVSIVIMGASILFFQHQSATFVEEL
jgi:lipopolysaccharide transport system permease protein